MQTDPQDLCEIILQDDDPRDYHEIILPPDRLQRNLYKIILPSRGDQTGHFTFQPLDGPVTVVISIRPPRDDSVVSESEPETDDEVTLAGFGLPPAREFLMMAHPPGDPLDICEVILPPAALDPRDIREIILPTDGPRWNWYKVILPSRGNQTCHFTFLPLDGPVTMDISVRPLPPHDSVVSESELETDDEVPVVDFGPAPRRSILRMAHDDSVISESEPETDDEVTVVAFGPAPRRSISRAHDDSIVSESEPETDDEVTVVDFGPAPRRSISGAHDESIVSESEPETDDEVTIISFGPVALRRIL